MKSSNVMMGLAFLVVAAISFTAVYFLLQKDEGGTSAKPIPVQPGAPAKGTSRATPKPVRPPRSGTRAPAKPRPPAEITGIVVDGEGKPVAGAKVSLLPPPKPVAPPPATNPDEVRKVGLVVELSVEDLESPRPLRSWADLPAPDPSRFAAEALTSADADAEGRFKFVHSPMYGPGPYRLVARSETLGSASRGGVAMGQKDVELVIASAGVVNGTIRAPNTGNGVKGAKIAFTSGDREWMTTSGEGGAFRIDDMPPGRYEVRAGSAEHPPLLGKRVEVRRGEPVEIAFPRGTTLRVKAVVDDGESVRRKPEDLPGVAGAEIVVLNEDTFAYVIGKTNDSGFAEFAGLPDGHWLINGRAEGLVVLSEESEILRPDALQHDSVLTFEKAVLTPLVVVDTGGTPVAGVEFFAGNPDTQYDVVHSEKLPGATDSEGRYSFAFEFMGRREKIYGFKKGYAVVIAAPDDYEEGKEERVTALPGGGVQGAVRTPDGKPIPGAIVTITTVVPKPQPGARPTFDPMEELEVRIVADADGRYRFPYLPAGWTVTVDAESQDGFFSDDAPDVAIEEGKTKDADLTVDLTPKVKVKPGGAMPVPPKAPAPGDGGKK
ncbi:MAG: hypothetical protein HMLKMBBP_00213 [Planctomycetes bacterium]|nr:hypothetical protein [Planctomycetota bacterium]